MFNRSEQRASDREETEFLGEDESGRRDGAAGRTGERTGVERDERRDEADRGLSGEE